MHDHEQHRRERWRRIRWVKRILRPLPRRATLHRYPVLKWFAEAARKRPYLWAFRTSAMAPSFYAGSVLSLEPAYGIQIPLALALALVLRANLPTMVGLQLITNPFTAVPIYLTTHKVGQFVIDLLGMHEPASMIGRKAYGLVIGGLVCGLALGAMLDVVYRLLAYEARKHHWHLPRRRKSKDSASPPPSQAEKQ